MREVVTADGYPLHCKVEFNVDAGHGAICEPELYTSRITGKLFSFVDEHDNDVIEEIGEIELTLLDFENAIEDDACLYTILDQSASLMRYYYALIEGGDGLYKDIVNANQLTNLLVIKSVILKSEFRGQGLGYFMIDRARRMFGVNALLALEAFPLQFSAAPLKTQFEVNFESEDRDIEQERTKLVEYYKRFGFEWSGYENVYFYNTEVRQPRLTDLITALHQKQAA